MNRDCWTHKYHKTCTLRFFSNAAIKMERDSENCSRKRDRENEMKELRWVLCCWVLCINVLFRWCTTTHIVHNLIRVHTLAHSLVCILLRLFFFLFTAIREPSPKECDSYTSMQIYIYTFYYVSIRFLLKLWFVMLCVWIAFAPFIRERASDWTRFSFHSCPFANHPLRLVLHFADRLLCHSRILWHLLAESPLSHTTVQ